MSVKIPPLTISELQAFIDVAESRSFRVAAERAFISQPGLSRRIRSAEDKLDTKLFDRTTRHVDLTSSGRELLPVARRIVEDFNDSLSEVSEYMNGGRGHVTIASLPSFAAIILPKVLASFRDIRPRVTVALKPVDATTTLELVCAGIADFGITVAPPPGRNLEYESFIVSDDLVVICSQNDLLSEQESVAWHIFAKRPYITSGADSSITPVVTRALEAHGINAQAQYEVANISVLGALVAEGLGIAAVPRRSLHLLDTRRLKVLPLAGAPFSREAGILRLKGRRVSSAAQGLLDILTEHMAKGHDSIEPAIEH